MFDWIKSILGLSPKRRFETEALYVRKVKRIIIADGKVSGRDLVEICGSKAKAAYSIEKLRKQGMKIICHVAPIDSGKKHQLCGSIVTYILKD